MKSSVAVIVFLSAVSIACSSPRERSKPASESATAPSASAAERPASKPVARASAPAATLTPPGAAVPAPTGGEKLAKPTKTPTYDVAAVGADQIANALARAKRDDKRVLVQWGANWCGWCNLLAATMKEDKAISKEVLYEYEVVKIDVGRFDKHVDLAQKYGAAIDGGIPYLTFLDADGKVLENRETGSLEDKTPDVQRHDPAKLLELLKQHETPRVEAAKLREAAFARAKAEGKRVFLHYGAPWCGWCHRLEDWMALPEIAVVLAKDFVDLKIDTDRRIGGQEMLDEMRGSKEGGIPWFAFVDADGTVLATSDGPQGNTGFPAAPAELAHFRTMLAKAATRITPAEIDALIASLVPKEK